MYNEESVLVEVIQSLMAYLSSTALSYEVIIVNDGSSDSTKDLLDEHFSPHDQLKIIHNKENGGVGFSFNEALKIATKDYITYYPGDGEFSPSEYNKLFPFLDGEKNIITYTTNSLEIRGIGRTLLSKIYTWMLNTIFGYRFKYYNGNSLYLLKDLRQIDVTAKGFTFTCELILRLGKAGAKFKQVAVELTPRSSGKSKALSPKSVVRVITELIRIVREVR